MPDRPYREVVMSTRRFPTWALLLLWSTLLGCFPSRPGPRLAHFADEAPALGERAPGFVLQDVGGLPVSLEDLIGVRPVVVQLGSRSCPVFRYRRFGVEGLIEEFRDAVEFVVVYTVEAHPDGSKSPYDDEEWLTWINRVTGVRVEQAESTVARRAEARETIDRLGLQQTVLVDDVDNEVWRAYGGAPSAAFVLDREGRVALRQVWIDPAEIRDVLRSLLED